MAGFAQNTKIDFPELAAIKRELAAKFAPNIRAKFLGAAINKATKPTAQVLKKKTRESFRKVSGNLLRSVTNTVRRYPKTGNAVGLVGFTKAGTGAKRLPTKGNTRRGYDLAYHAGLLIFGTKQRQTKRPIASSWRFRAPFKILKKAKRGKHAGSTAVRTSPKYPKAFFMKGSKGRGARLGRVYPNDVLTETLRQEANSIRTVLKQDMVDIVERAARFLEIKFPPKNK